MVLVNQAAGGGRAGSMWRRLEPLARRISEFRVETPAGPAASRKVIADAVEAGVDRIVVIGGDGTIHLVASALLAGPRRVVVGVVPAGTGSDLARALAIPRDPAAALRRAMLGAPQPMDAGHATGEDGSFHFANIASAGISGLVDSTVNAIANRGRATFLRATLVALRRYRCVPARVIVDGEPFYEGPLFLLAVANGTTFGKGMRIAPLADPADGLLDVVVVGAIAGWQLLHRLPQVYLGRHLAAGPVRYRRAREVELQPLAALPPFDVDGETYPSGATRFSTLPAALLMAGPDEVLR
jgi:diacylglycerol kinase (ATP)